MIDSQKNVGNWPKLDWVQAIRDPIWDYVVITGLEQKLLQTEVFSRLRGIKQLGFAYLSFPGATHSRFEHSLGVMHVSDQLLKYLTSKEGGLSIEKSSHRQLLRIAALLHDIGHAPFSHAIEDLLAFHPDIWTGIEKSKFSSDLKNYTGRDGNPYRHESYTAYLICNNPEIKNILKTWLREVDIVGKAGDEAFISDVIAKLAIGENIDNDEKYPDEYKKLGDIFCKIMSGDIDADKIDYLARDNYYCGLPYDLDINWLRKRIVVNRTNGNIELKPEGIKFVIAIVLARYSLFTEVHQDKWDSFTKLKVIEMLHEKLSVESPKNRAATIERLFTQWEDSKLLEYLFDKKGKKDTSFKKILTTEYPLSEIGRLVFADAHPYIRQAMEVLAEHPSYIPKLQKTLREITKTTDIYVNILRVKSPGFTTKIEDDNLLRNDILRGISEESLKNLHVVVFGKIENLSLLDDDKNLNNAINNLPVQEIDEFVIDLKTAPFKKLLASLVIQSYRQICQDCGKKHEILASDFVLLVMEFIAGISFGSAKKVEVTRQQIYKIAKIVSEPGAQAGFTINGKLDMDKEEITPSFYREIRKYEQLGLLTYSRRTERLAAEDEQDSNNEKFVFRFDRRFVLSPNGLIKLQKMRDLSHDTKGYKQYVTLWKKVHDHAESKRSQIERIIKGRNAAGAQGASRPARLGHG
jgi:HD superfamily phosphohydrolase